MMVEQHGYGDPVDLGCRRILHSTQLIEAPTQIGCSCSSVSFDLIFVLFFLLRVTQKHFRIEFEQPGLLD